MARKNPFANLGDEGRDGDRPVANDYAVRGASKAFIASIDEMAAKADKLIEGEAVVDLDVESVDESFVRDRVSSDDQEFQELLDAIREHGQASPILVRPHPSGSGRFMVVFGHRRLHAARLLGRKVRAVVKAMQDREHVIAQGQENSARANLSFIERALFAANLARLRYDDDNVTIMSALAIDRTTLSKMLSVAALPDRVLKGIGSAKGVGRDRWYELKLLLEKPSLHDVAINVIGEDSFASLSSDDRFNTLLLRLKATSSSTRNRTAQQKRTWASQDGTLAAQMSSKGKLFTLAIRAKGTDATAFGRYLSDNLNQLYEVFRQVTAANVNGD